MKQPQIGIDEQKKERDIIIENLKEDLRTNFQRDKFITTQYLRDNYSEKELAILKRELDENRALRSHFIRALDYAIGLELNAVGSWIHLGDKLLIGHRDGPALLAYRIATEIDATNRWAWEGLVQTEPKLCESDSYWPRYYTVKENDPSPSSIHSETWMKFARRETDWSLKIRMITRAIQNGGDLNTIWKFIKEMGKQSIKLHQQIESNWAKMKKHEQSQQRKRTEKEQEEWFILDEVLDDSGEKAKSRECDEMRKEIFAIRE
ncbi:MAG: hypothetical protein E4H14_18345 [Candidatus Thorarchaeota archaeon]|nr:MAG: hypothetical protein E4H14_18345 [Candidatus Thorarchaeota archaeon]